MMFHVEQLEAALSHLGTNNPTRVIRDLEHYVDLLANYNQSHNLISRESAKDIWHNHIFPSIAYAPILDQTCSYIDIGTGAGLPGLILKMLFPDLSIDLIDSNGKKTRFCKLACNEIECLSSANIFNSRVESHPQKYDAAVFRAVANVELLRKLSKYVIKTGGNFISIKGKGEVLKGVSETNIDPQLITLSPALANSIMIKGSV
jgi:16S rRNA (guanine527-N7)-methyltransferase